MVAVTGQIASSYDWKGTEWRISTADSGTLNCENTDDHNSGTFVESFSITATTTPGTYNAYFLVNGKSSCGSDERGSKLTMVGAVTVAWPTMPVPFSDSFGTADKNDVPNWDEAGNDSDSHVRILGSSSGEDTYRSAGNPKFMKIDDGDWACVRLDASSASNLELSYWWKGDAQAESSDKGVVEYKAGNGDCDTSGWTGLKEHSLNTTSWHEEATFGLPDALDGTIFRLRFKNNANHDDEYFRVDDVNVAPAPTEDTAELCADQIDNDNDGSVDLADSDCAAFIPRSDLTICKYYDNGTLGQYEQGIDTPLAWDMTVDALSGAAEGQQWGTGTNNETGCVTLAGMPYGDYRVTEQASTTWTQTYPAEGASQTITLDSATGSVYFLNYQPPQGPVIYGGDGACSDGTTPVLSGSYTIQSTYDDGKDGVSFSLIQGHEYLVRASGTFVPAGGWQADAGYSTHDNWSPLATQYGIHGTGSDLGAHALLADLGSGVGILDWGTYNSDHVYQRHFVASSTNVQFVIGDRWSTWFGTKWDKQLGMKDNSGSLLLDVFECQIPPADPDPVCGDGTVNQKSEQCDDGNTSDGDGCSALCQTESESAMCSTTIVSDTSDYVVQAEANAVATWVHPKAWTASILDATWIWKTFLVENPTQEETYTFRKSFTWSGGISSATLTVAADNTFAALLNSVSVGSGAGFAAGDERTFDVTADIQQGTNTLEVQTTNLAYQGSAYDNPAGLLYRLDVTGQCTPPSEDITVSGVKYNDVDGDGARGEEPGLPNWKIVAWTGKPLHAFDVNATNSEGVDVTLENGVQYLVKVSGTYDANDSITADAKYSYRSVSSVAWTDAVSNYESYGPTLLDLQVAGVTPEWGPYAGSDHTYWALVTGTGEPVNFRIYDLDPYSNNSGALQVEIYRGYLTMTDANGAYSFTLPQGTWNLAEQHQYPWQQTQPAENGYWTVSESAIDRNFGNNGGSVEPAVIVAPPVADPDPGNYPDPVNVTLLGEDGTTVRYTVGDGSNPEPTCTTGTLNDGAIAITQDSKIRAIACLGTVGSTVANFQYNIGPRQTGGGSFFQIVLGESTEGEGGGGATFPTSTASTTGAVLGESTSTGPTCSEYLSQYLWYGKKNDAGEVTKLQQFLNDHEGNTLPVTGFYGALTRAAVKAFQMKHIADILSPWDAFPKYKYADLGNVYKTTKWKINALMCSELNAPLPELP